MMIKRLMALFLAVTLVFGNSVSAAAAAEGQIEGTSGNEDSNGLIESSIGSDPEEDQEDQEDASEGESVSEETAPGEESIEGKTEAEGNSETEGENVVGGNEVGGNSEAGGENETGGNSEGENVAGGISEEEGENASEGNSEEEEENTSGGNIESEGETVTGGNNEAGEESAAEGNDESEGEAASEENNEAEKTENEAAGAMSTSQASAEDFEYTVDTGYATITGYSGQAAVLNIPASIGGYPIEAIASNAFNGCTCLTKVELPGNVTSIGENAFYNCTNLSEIVLNDGLKSLGYGFISGTAVMELTVPKTVISMPYALEGASGLKKIVFSQGMKSIPSQAVCFSDNSRNNVEEIVIPDSVTMIEASAFRGCGKLKAAVFPASVKNIENYAFEGCAGLTKVEIPGNITSIGEGAFNECINLSEIVLNDGLESIGSDFISGTAVTELTVPKTVTNMWYAFGYNNSASRLKKVVFSQGMESIPSAALCFVNNKVEEVVVPDSVTKIESSAFSGCRNLKSVNLPEKLEEIEASAFSDCIGLTEIEFPAGLKSMGNSAFSGCTGLTEIGISAGLTEIGEYAFNGCTGLTEIRISDGLKGIGRYAFSGCTGLTKVEVPGNVTSIGEGTFYECTSLSEIALNDGLESIGSDFISRTAVTELTVPKTVTNMWCALGYNYEAARLKRVVFSQGMETIPYGALYFGNSDNNNVEEVIIPDSVTMIEGNAFEGFKGILKIASENSIAVIYAIDHEISYEVYRSGLEDGGNGHLDRSKSFYNLALSSSTTSGYVNLSIHYAFKEESKPYVDTANMTLKIKIPASATLVHNSFKLDGKTLDAEADDDGYILLPLEQKEGSASFALNLSDRSYLLSYAQLEYSYKDTRRAETVGIVNMENGILTLKVPDTTSDSLVKVNGLAEPNQEISLFIDDVESGKAVASKTGLYSAALSLPEPQEGDMYKIEAKTYSDGKTNSAVAYTEYTKKAVEITECKMYYRENTYDLLALEGKRPVISWASGTTFTFKVAFNDPGSIGEVYIVSTKNGETRRLEATWNENKQAFVAAGFTGYVPGYISVEYEEGLNGGFKNASSVIETVFDESGVIGNESKVTMEDGTEFYYSMEQIESISGLPDEKLDRVDIEGRTYYLSPELGYMEKGNKAYAYQDLYLLQSDGRYTLLRTSIGLPESEASGSSSQTFKASDPAKDAFDKVKAFVDFLADTSESGSTKESEVYLALEETLNSLLSAFDSSATEYWELVQLKYELQSVKIMGSTQGVYNKINKVIKYSSKYSSDPDILQGDKIAEKMEEMVNAMQEASKRIENRQLRSIMERLCKKGWFQESLMEKALKKLGEKKSSSCGFNPKFAIDPSGYVYEAVTNNRIEGVKATIYYKASQEAQAVLWAAEEYDQNNPLYTDKLGAYAWDVPEGYWQVKYEKEGYDTAYSEWLPVPPPQLDVNIGLVSKEKPAIENVDIYSDYARVVFSKYMDPESLAGLRLSGNSGKNIPYILEYDRSQANPAGINYAKEFTIRFQEGTLLEKGTICKLALDGKATSYAGIAADAAEYEEKVETYMEIVAPDSVTVKMGETLEVPIRVLNAKGVMNMEVVSGFDEIAIAEITKDGNVKVTGQLYGETELYLSIPGTGISKVIRVTVGKKSLEIETKPTVSIQGTVASAGRDSAITIQLVGTNGDIVAEKEIMGNSKEYRLDDMAAGTYTMRVSKADHVDRNYPIMVTAGSTIVQNIELWLIGDVNGDGKVNAKDKKILYNHIAGSSPLTDYAFLVGDVNGDGRVNAKDKKMVYNHIAGSQLLW